jgi:plastocyanin domain-containing protein
MIQTIITIIIIAIALYYFFLKARKNILKFVHKKENKKKGSCDSCDGCPLKENNNCDKK